jgi:hypothetical protein
MAKGITQPTEKEKVSFQPLINIAPQNIFRENRKRNKNDQTEAKKQKIDPVHQLLIDGLPPPKPITPITQPLHSSQTPQKSESVTPIASSTSLPSSLSVQPTQKTPPTQILRSEPHIIQKKDNSNDAVLNRKEPMTSKKPALKDMMKLFDFDCSDSE